MTTARDEVLNRIRRALADRPAADPPARDYRGTSGLALDDPIALLTERISDYRAGVHHCPAIDIAGAITGLLTDRGIHRLVVPDGFPPAWIDGVPVEHVIDNPLLTSDDLDATDGVITTCALAIALTGTIVLDAGPGQGRRALTLVPDYHLVVLHADQIVPGVPDAIAALDPTRPLTWISGPSATSDIELQRVEGVHGPRTLDVLITT